jgi:hypothetical protein
MSVVGAATANGWARVIVAALIAFGVPLLAADRLLDKDPSKRAKGLVTDVIAIAWLATVVLFAGVLNSATRSMLATEGDRLTVEGFESLGQITYFLGGVAMTPAPAITTNATASASASASAPTASASAAPSSSAPAPKASP